MAKDDTKMQANLKRLVMWSKEWQLGLHLGNNNHQLDYHLNGITLMNDTVEKNLGIRVYNRQ